MTSEMQPILKQLQLSKIKLSKVKPASQSHKDGIGLPLYYTARIDNMNLVIALAGVGDNARGATSRLLDLMPFSHVMVVGVAGGIDPILQIGDVVIPKIVTDLDTEITYNPTLQTEKINSGILATASTILEDEHRLARLRANGITAIDMETSIIARVCSDKGVPWSVFRGISDLLPGGPITNEIVKLVHPNGTTNLKAVSKYLLKHPTQVKVLAKLGKDTVHAASSAARASLEVLGI